MTSGTDQRVLSARAVAAAPLVGAPPVLAAPRVAGALYRRLLLWAFTTFNVLRLFTYLPTMWAIHQSARSDQHSLITWIGWTLANLTMALWLFERSGHKLDGAVAVNVGNALLCAAVTLLIVGYRF